ncbi:hypothetical protein M8R20_06890 [Pseudomonas sp. R2.Fl]|nr:hypothetical protein [Pseudomonas sp. R2.Fl]
MRKFPRTSFGAGVIAIAALISAMPANAISRYNSMSMTCEQARQAIRSQGAVILRFPSKNVANLTRFDRYVRNSRYCDSREYAEWTRIPTRDNPGCRVLACEPIPRRDRDFPFWIVPNYSL